ncbi:MAG: hypothetical protein NTY88_10960 [Bacteroidetes bacterium]|nr:hypothetical protein [Bacteroidota bacterium]
MNQFLKIIFASPSMLWKAGAALIFLCFSLALFFVPSLTVGFTTNSRYAFGGLMLFYSLFRFYGFYSEYKQANRE